MTPTNTEIDREIGAYGHYQVVRDRGYWIVLRDTGQQCSIAFARKVNAVKMAERLAKREAQAESDDDHSLRFDVEGIDY